MDKKNTADWGKIILAVIKMIGLWMLKIVGFCSWIVLSGISIILREIVDSLKKWLFPKDY